MRNATTKSVILAPFNTTLDDVNAEVSLESADHYIKGDKFNLGIRIWDIDRQYEQNYNKDLDNGVFNEFVRWSNTEAAEEREVVSQHRSTESNVASMWQMILETEEEQEDEIEEERLLNVKTVILNESFKKQMNKR